MGGSPDHQGYRPHLDGLRAVAVLLVVAYHAGFAAISGGFVGVDVFFVLSGYLITRLLVAELVADGRLRLPRFYARRMRRLLPASALALGGAVFASIHLLDRAQQLAVAEDVRWSALWSANWRFVQARTDYFAPGDVPSPVVHYWSLAVEEQFYLVWPALLLGLWWLLARRAGRPTAALAAAI
ncbi:MAG TPA: acyltransferase, partial [Acidimicrobiales bacterium]|nr:acyltransferase [Acidimicrobiales bacterium]